MLPSELLDLGVGKLQRRQHVGRDDRLGALDLLGGDLERRWIPSVERARVFSHGVKAARAHVVDDAGHDVAYLRSVSRGLRGGFLQVVHRQSPPLRLALLSAIPGADTIR